MSGKSQYSDAIAEKICERIVTSDYGLEQVCAASDLPCASTVYKWLQQHDSFAEQYARARELQAHTQHDRGVRDALEARDAQLGRLRFDARRWSAAKLNPKVYGDRIQAEHTGPSGAPLLIVTGVPDVIPLIDGEYTDVTKYSEAEGEGAEVLEAANTDTYTCDVLPLAPPQPTGEREGGYAVDRLARSEPKGEVSHPPTRSKPYTQGRWRGRGRKAD
jgi:hypothetical protein